MLLHANSAPDTHLGLLRIPNQQLEACAALLALVDETGIAPNAVFEKIARGDSVFFGSRGGQDERFVAARIPPAPDARHHVGDAVVGRFGR